MEEDDDLSSPSTVSTSGFMASLKYTSPEVWEGDYTFTTDNWWDYFFFWSTLLNVC